MTTPTNPRQQELDLRVRKVGGARPGAGRPRKTDAQRGFVAHRTRASHRKGDPVHVTLSVRRCIPSLRSQLLSRHVKRALDAQRKKLAAEVNASAGTNTESVGGVARFQIVHFTIQEDHLHLIVEAADKRAIARAVAGLEVRIARAINKVLGRKGRFWAERYHRRDLRTPTEVRSAIRYVLLNFRKHSRVIGEAFADPHSSAPTFDGFARPPILVDVHDDDDDESLRWPRVAPRTWLLGVGWRGRGLIDPADGPVSVRKRRVRR